MLVGTDANGKKYTYRGTDEFGAPNIIEYLPGGVKTQISYLDEDRYAPLTEAELASYDPKTGTYKKESGNSLIDSLSGKVIATNQKFLGSYDPNNFVIDAYDTGNFFKGKDKAFGIRLSPEGVPIPYISTERTGLSADPLALAAILGITGLGLFGGAGAAGAGASSAGAGAAGAAGAEAVGSALFNAAVDSQLANAAIQAAGGDALAGYLAAGATPTAVNIGSTLFSAGAPISPVFNPAVDSQIANEAIAAAGGDPLAGYLDPSLAPSVVNVNGALYGANAAEVAAASAATGIPVGGPVTPTTAGAGSVTKALTETLKKGATGLLSNPSSLASLLSLLGTANLGSGGGGGGGVGQLPTQGIPQNTPEYYNQVQGFLNQYLPGEMPNQSQYLQSWYGSGGSVPVQQTGGMAPIPNINQLLAALQQPQPMYTSLSKQSDPVDIALAYAQFVSDKGGDTKANQDEAIKYLKSLGVSDETINEAYDIFKG